MHKAIRGMSIAAIALMLVAGVTAVQAEPKGPPEGGNRCPCFDAARLAEIEMPFDHCVIHFPSLGQSYYTNIIHGYGDGFAGAQVTFSGPGEAGHSCAWVEYVDGEVVWVENRYIKLETAIACDETLIEFLLQHADQCLYFEDFR